MEFAQNNKKKRASPNIPVCIRACLFRHELNLAQHANIVQVVQYTILLKPSDWNAVKASLQTDEM